MNQRQVHNILNTNRPALDYDYRTIVERIKDELAVVVLQNDLPLITIVEQIKDGLTFAIPMELRWITMAQ
jgi:hypothetical protein